MSIFLPVADIQQSILLDAPKEVDVPAIERELTQLWKKASDDSDGSSSPVVRACSLNFIVFSEGVDTASGLEEIVSQVTVDHPSRIFLVSADRGASRAAMDAWVSARCSLPVPGGKQVCCEEINLVARGTDARKIPSVITSLLVPDVPTILLWKASVHPRDSVLLSVTQIADRVLSDSSEDVHPLESLVAWGGFVDEHRDRTAFGDMAWTHLDQWRTLLAQVFQPVELRSHLTALDAVTIEYSSTESPGHSGLSQALLCAGWLANSLHWVLVHPIRGKTDGAYAATFRVDEKAISLKIVETTPQGKRPGGIESITLRSTNGGEFSLRTSARGDCVLLAKTVGEVPQSSVESVHLQTEAELVSREMEVLHHDSSYESSLTAVVQ
ncbi:MAG: glucose-6-phosphate dehydrogenase assembly protein OpcA [Bacteroidota bacterium]